MVTVYITFEHSLTAEFVHDKLIELSSEFRIKCLNELTSSLSFNHDDLSVAPKFHKWYYIVSTTVNETMKALVEYHLRKHQLIPISRRPQKCLEEVADKSFAHGDKYTGQVIDNKRHGHGSCRYAIAAQGRFDGEWLNDKRHGPGVVTDGKGVYEGDWHNDTKSGFGTFVTRGGEKYEGGWNGDKREGYGVYTYKNGDTFEGHWSKDKFVFGKKTVNKTKMIIYEDGKPQNKTTVNVTELHVKKSSIFMRSVKQVKIF